jgi:hypothetical protein
MKELFSVLRLAVYVLALPLTVTAAASAHQWINASARVVVSASEVANVIRLTEGGTLRGVVSTYDAARGKVSVGNAVVTLMQGETVVARVNSGVDGAFSFSNVDPGKYTFISAATGSIAAFGIEAVGADSETGAPVLRAFAAPRNATVDGIAKAAPSNVGPASEMGQVLYTSEVVTAIDGAFQGTVAALNGNVEGNSISLIQGDKLIAEATTDGEGVFRMDGVSNGFYTLMARGAGGFAAVAVEVTGAESVAPTETVYTSLQEQEESVGVTMTDSPIEFEIVEEIITVEEIEEESMIVPLQSACCGSAAPMGFGGGSMGGGFGGGLGMSGVGELIGLGIGAWVLTEVIDQIDGNNIPRPVPVPNPPAPVSGYTWVYL